MNLNTVISLSAHASDTPSAGAKTEMHGLPITIEHPRGSIRKLHDDSGKVVYKKHMHYSYGFFNGTKGRDGDEVDCMLGPIKYAKEVYVVHMRDMGPVPSEREDEDKCMIGFQSADAAKAAFLMHYPENFYAGMTALPVDEFKERMAKASLPYMKKKITAGFLTLDDCYRAFNSVLAAGKCPQCGGPVTPAKRGYTKPKNHGFDCVECDRTWNKKDLQASAGVCSRCKHQFDVKDRRVGFCQKCGKKVGKMQADNNSIGVIGDPAAAKHLAEMPKSPIKAGGPGSGRHKTGSRVTVHYSPSIRQHATVVGHEANGWYKVKFANGNESRVQPEKVKPFSTGRVPVDPASRVNGPAGKIHRLLSKPPMFGESSRRKESAESDQSIRSGRSVRSTLQKLVVEATAKGTCPKCGGRKITLMPTDFETAKCRDCGKTWQHPDPPMPGDRMKRKLAKKKARMNVAAFPNQVPLLPPVG